MSPLLSLKFNPLNLFKTFLHHQAINPSVFLFNAIATQPIINQSQATQTVLGTPTLGLGLRNQQSLVLVGGDINLDGGQLVALGGRVDLVSIKGVGTVELITDSNRLAVKIPDGVPRGNISLSNQAEIFVRSSLGGGAINISARDFRMSGESNLLAGNLGNQELAETKSGNIIISATDTVKLTENSSIYNSLSSGSIGQAGDINIKTQFLEMSDRAQIGGSVFGKGNGGNISIEASQAISIKDSLERVNQPTVGTGILNVVGFGGNGKAGSISILTPSLSLTEGAQILGSLSGQGIAATIDLNISDSTVLDTGSLISSSVAAGGEGTGGEINVRTGSLSLLNGSKLLAIVRRVGDEQPAGKGDAGSINITARDQVIVSGIFSEEIPSQSIIATSIDTGATGKAGNISIKTDRFSLTNDGEIRSTLDLDASGQAGNIQIDAKTISVTREGIITTATSGQGNAGDILINAQERASFDGDAKISTSAPASAEGNSGGLTIKTGALFVTNGSRLLTTSDGSGNSGSLDLQASDSVQLSSGGVIKTTASGNGNSGDLRVKTSDLVITDGSVLGTNALGAGKGGDLTILASDSVKVIGTTPDSQAVSIIFAGATGSGNAGNLRIDTKKLIVQDGATISSETQGSGKGGDVIINAPESVEVIGQSSNGQFSAAITSETEKSGNAGNLVIYTGRLLVKDGAYIAARGTQGSTGNAGNVTLIAKDSVTVDGGSPTRARASFISTETRLPDDLEGFEGFPGNAGDLTITTQNLKVIDGGEIAADSIGLRKAGTLDLNIGDSLEMNNGNISSVAYFASGGDIRIFAKKILLRGDSDIKTVVPLRNSDGTITSGGNIIITANSVVVLDDSDILTFNRGGKGGDITFNTPAFFGQNYRPAPFGTDPETLDGNDRVDINATGTVSGIISLPDVRFIQNNLTQLPNSQIDTNKLLAQTCLIRKDQPEGTFYITGTGSLPNRPNDLSLSDYPTNTIQPTTPTAQRPWKLGDPIIEPQGFYQLANGRLVMSRECNQ